MSSEKERVYRDVPETYTYRSRGKQASKPLGSQVYEDMVLAVVHPKEDGSLVWVVPNRDEETPFEVISGMFPDVTFECLEYDDDGEVCRHGLVLGKKCIKKFV